MKKHFFLLSLFICLLFSMWHCTDPAAPVTNITEITTNIFITNVTRPFPYITNDITWSKDLHLYSPVVIQSGGNLKILKGVNVTFYHHTLLELVEGSFTANGTASDRITFSLPTTNYNATINNLTLNYVNIVNSFYISDSTISNGILSNVDEIYDSTVIQSDVVANHISDSTIVQSDVVDSQIDNSTVIQSDVVASKIRYSTISNSVLSNIENMNGVNLINCDILDVSNISGCTLVNCYTNKIIHLEHSTTTNDRSTPNF